VRGIKSYITGGLVAILLFYFPSLKKWKIIDKKENENDNNTKQNEAKRSLKTISLQKAIQMDIHTIYESELLGRPVLFHKMTNHKEFEYQNYAFAGNIMNVYKDTNEQIKYDVKLFMSSTNICIIELEKIIRKDITKDLILKGFVRSELILA
jgi:hypothetical protein